MAVTINTGFPNNSASVVNFQSAALTSDAAAATDFVWNVGFQARYVKLLNVTDVTTLEAFDGNTAAGSALAEAANGTKSITAAGIVIDRNNVTIKAASLPASKSFLIIAFG